MAPRPTQDETSEKIAHLATEHVTLPAFALIGTFGPAASPAALVRATDMSFHRVAPGDKLEGFVVAAIDADRLTLAKGARTKVLRLPTP